MPTRVVRLRLVALVILACIALVYAWPLVARLTTAIPGSSSDVDVATFVWNVGWTRDALTNGYDMLHTDTVLLPFGADLRLHTYGLLQGLIAYVPLHLLGVVGAFNLMVLMTLWLNGVAAYGLVVYETGDDLAALVASVCLMLAGPLLGQLVVGRPSFASLWIVIGVLLTLMSLLARPKLWKGAVLGGWLVAALLSDFQMLLFSAIWLALTLAWYAWRLRQRLFDPQRVMALGMAFAVFSLPFAWLYLPPLVSANATGYPRPSLNDMLPYSFRLWDYVTPMVVIAYGGELLVGGLAGLMILNRPGRWQFWLIGGLVCLILALGPFLQPTRIPLPLALFRLWPPLAQFRTPYRLAIPSLIGFSVVLGYVLAAVWPRLPTRWLAWGIAGLVIIARLAFALWHDPFPIQAYPDYPVYHRLAVEPGEFTLLEVPFGIRSGLDRIGNGGEALQFYQHIHGKWLLNAMIARLPKSVFDFYRAHPALLFLSGEPYRGDDATLNRDFADVLLWSRSRYVLVHRAWLTPDQATAISAFLDRQPSLTKVGVEDDLLIYLVTP